MPAIYDRMGVRFMYPDNWEVDEGEPFEDRNTVSVYHPDGAFWSLMIAPPDADLDERLAEVVAALRAEYPNLDSERAQEPLAGQQLTGFDVNFFYLDLINAAMIRGWQTPQATYIVLCQAEDREFDELESIFRAITISLLREL